MTLYYDVFSVYCDRCYGKLGTGHLQRDSPAGRPPELLLQVQAVGGSGGGTRTGASVVRQPRHHGKIVIVVKKQWYISVILVVK